MPCADKLTSLNLSALLHIIWLVEKQQTSNTTARQTRAADAPLTFMTCRPSQLPEKRHSTAARYDVTTLATILTDK